MNYKEEIQKVEKAICALKLLKKSLSDTEK